MLPFHGQVSTLAMMLLSVARTLATNGNSIGSNIDSGIDGLVSSAEGEGTQLVGDLDGDFDKFESEVESELIGALRNSSGNLAQFTIGHETTPPISTYLVTSGVDSNVTVGLYCDKCDYAQPTAFDFASQNYSGWNSSWLGFVLDSFDALFEVVIDLSEVASGELTLGLFSKTAAQDGVVVEVEFQLYVVADASASMTFTTGLNLSLLEPAAIMMPALDPMASLNESQRIGFDQENFILHPIFNASMPQLNFSIQFSLRTVFSVTFEDINIGALYLDLPAFNLTVNTLPTAMYNCQPPPAGTPSNEIYSDLIQANGAFVAELSYELLEGGRTGVLDTWLIGEAYNSCHAFFPALGFISDVPPSPKSPNLTETAITTCTTGGTTSTTSAAAVREVLKSLSPGAKAGAVIGALVGVTIIAALAFCGGRASLSQRLKNSGKGSVWTTPRPRPGKIFSRGIRGIRGGTTEFSPVNPNTPAWENTAYGGGFFATAHPGWETQKEEPYVSVDETVTPVTTYASIGEDYGMPITGVGQTNDTRYEIETHPARCDVVRAGHVEGLGLLPREARPDLRRKEIKRKEISRKSVSVQGNGISSAGKRQAT